MPVVFVDTHTPWHRGMHTHTFNCSSSLHRLYTRRIVLYHYYYFFSFLFPGIKWVIFLLFFLKKGKKIKIQRKGSLSSLVLDMQVGQTDMFAMKAIWNEMTVTRTQGQGFSR